MADVTQASIANVKLAFKTFKFVSSYFWPSLDAFNVFEDRQLLAQECNFAHADILFQASHGHRSGLLELNNRLVSVFLLLLAELCD